MQTIHTQTSKTVNKKHCMQGVIFDINEIDKIKMFLQKITF